MSIAFASRDADSIVGRGVGETFPDIRIVRKTFTAAQLQAIVATPVEIVPAPGAGYILVPMAVYWSLDYGGTAFSGAASHSIRVCWDGTYANNTSSNFNPTTSGLFDILTQTADYVTAGTPSFSAGGNALLGFVNKNLALRGTGTPHSAGNGALHLTMLYMVVRTNL